MSQATGGFPVEEIDTRTMPRPHLQILPHLDHPELTQRYRECTDPRTKSHWLVIRLLSDLDTPMTVEQVAAILGFSPDWVRKLVGRYNRLGPEGFITNHRRNRSRKNIVRN